MQRTVKRMIHFLPVRSRSDEMNGIFLMPQLKKNMKMLPPSAQMKHSGPRG